eukprot:g955.t1
MLVSGPCLEDIPSPWSTSKAKAQQTIASKLDSQLLSADQNISINICRLFQALHCASHSPHSLRLVFTAPASTTKTENCGRPLIGWPGTIFGEPKILILSSLCPVEPGRASQEGESARRDFINYQVLSASP